MTKLTGRVESVHAGDGDNLGKEEQAEIQVELDGIVGDAHRAFERKTWSGDKQAKGTLRRNERLWSAVSAEELAEISSDMDLAEPLTAEDLGANLCLSGIDQLSRLSKGTTLIFPSGAVLIVEEYNPPCHDMGKKLASKYSTRSGRELRSTEFSIAAKVKRGIVGVVDVAGSIRPGDDITVEIYEAPSWLARTDD